MDLPEPEFTGLIYCGDESFTQGECRVAPPIDALAPAVGVEMEVDRIRQIHF